MPTVGYESLRCSSNCTVSAWILSGHFVDDASVDTVGAQLQTLNGARLVRAYLGGGACVNHCLMNRAHANTACILLLPEEFPNT